MQNSVIPVPIQVAHLCMERLHYYEAKWTYCHWYTSQHIVTMKKTMCTSESSCTQSNCDDTSNTRECEWVRACAMLSVFYETRILHSHILTGSYGLGVYQQCTLAIHDHRNWYEVWQSTTRELLRSKLYPCDQFACTSSNVKKTWIGNWRRVGRDIV